MIKDECIDGYIASGIVGVLFLLSEIIGWSRCEYTGVFQLIVSGFSCFGRKVDIDIRYGEEEVLLEA